MHVYFKSFCLSTKEDRITLAKVDFKDIKVSFYLILVCEIEVTTN